MTKLTFPHKKKRKFFNVDKFKSYKEKQKIWPIIFVFSLIMVIYVSYVQTFTLVVIFVWSLFLLSIYSILFYTIKIHFLEQAKNEFLIILEQNYDMELLKLAQKIEYPYSIFKQIIDYLVQTGELVIE